MGVDLFVAAVILPVSFFFFFFGPFTSHVKKMKKLS